ncbi:PDZ domain-containing protein [Polycladomyces subterraneus]|uniref:PDZ domain-containing protein n=1 Tax=Polycladomyces subterraneus TaxID=1016997 RepID=A0ABT8INK9_9BACL|nr:PDZ domain-containing protein [Polycladomyces subterraneus]MDN4594383.1 PDZ domain-containing protein [Polycladomyces subterraneus]
MTSWLAFPLSSPNTWKALLVHPLWWTALVCMLMQFVFKGLREWRKYGRRLDPPTPLLLRTFFWGAVGGGVCSVLVSFWQWEVRPMELWWIWGWTVVLGLFRLRWACVAFGGGLLVLFALVASHVSAEQVPPEWLDVWRRLSLVSVTDWLYLIGLLHVLEWLLIRVDGLAGFIPETVRHRDGYIVGGFRLQKLWAVPLIVPTASGWLPLPLLLGFSRLNLSMIHQQQKRRASTFALLYALILAGLTWASTWWTPLIWAAAVFAVVGHEAIYLVGKWREKRREPRFASHFRGMSVLAVLPETPASQMGIRPGERITRMNGVHIRTMDDIRLAMQKSPAYCKLEVVDELGETRMVQRAIYEGDPSDLGVIPSPGPINRISSPVSEVVSP